MSNMGYCRFQNTVKDLRDCEQHLFDDDLDIEERRARRNLVRICIKIAKDIKEEDLE